MHFKTSVFYVDPQNQCLLLEGKKKKKSVTLKKNVHEGRLVGTPVLEITGVVAMCLYLSVLVHASVRMSLSPLSGMSLCMWGGLGGSVTVGGPCLGTHRCLWVVWCGQSSGQEASTPGACGAWTGPSCPILAPTHACHREGRRERRGEGGEGVLPGPDPDAKAVSLSPAAGLIPSPTVSPALGQWQH